MPDHGMLTRPPFAVIQPLQCRGIARVRAQPVHRLGRKRDQLAVAQRLCSERDGFSGGGADQGKTSPPIRAPSGGAPEFGRISILSRTGLVPAQLTKSWSVDERLSFYIGIRSEERRVGKECRIRV